MDSRRKIYILGGGIAGLSAGYFARQRFPKAEIHIYEAAKKLGGRCQTFYSHKLGINLDNATHVILGANKYANKFLLSNDFINKPYYYDVIASKVDNTRIKHSELILRSIFNTEAKSVDYSCIFKLGLKLFPYFTSQLKMYYSQHSLEKDLISPWAFVSGNIHTNMPLKGIEVDNQCINKLIFANQYIEVAKNDIVISALDAYNYHKIFRDYEFEFNRIVNIFYRTSQKLTLPNNAEILGIEGANFDWLFVTDNTIGVTISNVDKNLRCNDMMAIEIWQKICQIRNVKPAFIPAFQILDYPRATIAQDKNNNHKRPNKAQGKYKNLFLSGDWTMKNWPCCIESAITSAHRAIYSI